MMGMQNLSSDGNSSYLRWYTAKVQYMSSEGLPVVTAVDVLSSDMTAAAIGVRETIPPEAVIVGMFYSGTSEDYIREMKNFG